MNIKDVTDAMNVLKNRYNKKAKQVEIVIAWWDKEWFELMLDTKLSNDEWLDIVFTAEEVIEHCGIGDWLINETKQTLDEIREKGE